MITHSYIVKEFDTNDDERTWARKQFSTAKAALDYAADNPRDRTAYAVTHMIGDRNWITTGIYRILDAVG